MPNMNAVQSSIRLGCLPRQDDLFVQQVLGAAGFPLHFDFPQSRLQAGGADILQSLRINSQFQVLIQGGVEGR